MSLIHPILTLPNIKTECVPHLAGSVKPLYHGRVVEEFSHDFTEQNVPITRYGRFTENNATFVTVEEMTADIKSLSLMRVSP